MSDRIQKEKYFHNARFNKETRESLNKFYSISPLIDNDFRELINKSIKGKCVLEYGCGLGIKSTELALYSSVVHAIDISEVAIEKARSFVEEKGITNLNFYVMNAEQLEFPDSYFDVVCGTSILHHLELKSAYYQLARVLKPNGKAYFIEPLGHNIFINLFRKLTANLRTEDEHPLKVKDLKLLFNYFNYVRINYYYLLSLFAVPFRAKKYFFSTLKTLNVIDQLLFKIPFIRTQAWQVIIEVADPKK